jgi:hypothetical protein
MLSAVGFNVVINMPNIKEVRDLWKDVFYSIYKAAGLVGCN